MMVASKDLVNEGKKEDLRTIWESLEFGWYVGNDRFCKCDGEEGWNPEKDQDDLVQSNVV